MAGQRGRVQEREGMDEEWAELVHKADNGTLFHRPRFLRYHPGSRFDGRYLKLYHKGACKALFSYHVIDGRAVSPFGASFGGIVHRNDLPVRYIDEIVNELVNWLSERYPATYITPTPTVYLEKHQEASEFCLLRNGFELEAAEMIQVIDLDQFESDPFERFTESRRRNVRKAKKEDVRLVEDSPRLKTYYDLLSTTLERHETTPTHTLEELMDLRERFPDRFRLDVALVDDEVIGGIYYFVVNDRVINSFYIAHKQEYSRKNPISYLVYEGIKTAKQDGFSYYNLGASSHDLDIKNPGIARFKSGFGTCVALRKRFLLESA
jgi:hypothetical protein